MEPRKTQKRLSDAQRIEVYTRHSRFKVGKLKALRLEFQVTLEALSKIWKRAYDTKADQADKVTYEHRVENLIESYFKVTAVSTL
ncbi:hypothetical protein DYB37_006437 [Aphanomyces astaci]|uniref:Uncharacterized protein n=1 Tax=Aphanomyces astaci TaxID=112090 RepID=A0A3R7AP17_APHAT|nr:hypothetical protein DYB35_012942 [Aphanomyces astaci]RHZ26702.1 hypothetical protein DYB37_006437 [Aphanomyces astaci]